MIDKTKLKIAILDYESECKIYNQYEKEAEAKLDKMNEQEDIVTIRWNKIREILGIVQGQEFTDGQYELVKQLL